LIIQGLDESILQGESNSRRNALQTIFDRSYPADSALLLSTQLLRTLPYAEEMITTKGGYK
jgi:hypothetical protein